MEDDSQTKKEEMHNGGEEVTEKMLWNGSPTHRRL
jgi:hypothetical protein